MKEIDIRLDSEALAVLGRQKRNFIIELRGKDFVLKHAALDFLEKMKMYDRRKAV